MKNIIFYLVALLSLANHGTYAMEQEKTIVDLVQNDEPIENTHAYEEKTVEELEDGECKESRYDFSTIVVKEEPTLEDVLQQQQVDGHKNSNTTTVVLLERSDSQNTTSTELDNPLDDALSSLLNSNMPVGLSRQESRMSSTSSSDLEQIEEKMVHAFLVEINRIQSLRSPAQRTLQFGNFAQQLRNELVAASRRGVCQACMEKVYEALDVIYAEIYNKLINKKTKSAKRIKRFLNYREEQKRRRLEVNESNSSDDEQNEVVYVEPVDVGNNLQQLPVIDLSSSVEQEYNNPQVHVLFDLPVLEIVYPENVNNEEKKEEINELDLEEIIPLVPDVVRSLVYEEQQEGSDEVESNHSDEVESNHSDEVESNHSDEVENQYQNDNNQNQDLINQYQENEEQKQQEEQNVKIEDAKIKEAFEKIEHNLATKNNCCLSPRTLALIACVTTVGIGSVIAGCSVYDCSAYNPY